MYSALRTALWDSQCIRHATVALILPQGSPLSLVFGVIMYIVKCSVISEFLGQTPGASKTLALWYKLVCHSQWSSFDDLCRTFPTAEKSRNLTVFSIGCGSIFVVTYVDYRRGKLFVREIYDKQYLQRQNQVLSRTNQ